ncbi:hypothetical protein L596_022828 [Steinernema carpocapsae]|uniref:Uncharacterized protein n=1 Tax=Steinernema carpocapsae TaxID=34508 RepID=A0A4U5MMW7_STECR|nr:hypothetical protein L596_022828 [Steinernema carpocapsae]
MRGPSPVVRGGLRETDRRQHRDSPPRPPRRFWRTVPSRAREEPRHSKFEEPFWRNRTAIVSFRTSFNSTRASSPFFSEFFATISSAVPNFPLTLLSFPFIPLICLLLLLFVLFILRRALRFTDSPLPASPCDA